MEIIVTIEDACALELIAMLKNFTCTGSVHVHHCGHVCAVCVCVCACVCVRAKNNNKKLTNVNSPACLWRSESSCLKVATRLMATLQCTYISNTMSLKTTIYTAQ